MKLLAFFEIACLDSILNQSVFKVHFESKCKNIGLAAAACYRCRIRLDFIHGNPPTDARTPLDDLNRFLVLASLNRLIVGKFKATKGAWLTFRRLAAQGASFSEDSIHANRDARSSASDLEHLVLSRRHSSGRRDPYEHGSPTTIYQRVKFCTDAECGKVAAVRRRYR